MKIMAEAQVDECPRTMPALERALLRRGVKHRDARHQRCFYCQRTPLVGERIYLADSGPVLCELCRSGEPTSPLQGRVVRGPSLGQVIRTTDRGSA